MISRIKWKNHHILGNLELDLTNEGKTYSTIIIAGENGTGKTTILDTISGFLNLGPITPFEYIEYVVNDKCYRVSYDEKDGEGHLYGFHDRIEKITGNTKKILSRVSSDRKLLEKDRNDIRHYGVVYSKARSGFNTGIVNSTTTEQIDFSPFNDDKNDDFTCVKQLLVDLSAQDNSEWMRITKNKENISYEEFEQQSRLNRFEKAFNSFFDGLKFKEINEQDPKVQISLDRYERFATNGISISV